MKQHFFFLLFFFSTLVSVAQYEIVGVINDNTAKPLSFASVVLLDAADSSVSTFTLSNDDGFYKLEVKDSSRYLIQYTFLGYRTVINALQTDWSVRKIEVNDVELQETDIALKTVEIEEDRIPMKMKGDTLVYDAQAFKTRDGADVEKLLEMLPGLEIDKDGNLMAQGKKVEKILVDGKDFFGADPKMATKNLDAEAIKKVEVLDKKSEEADFTGVDDGEEVKTINLTLKEEYKKGQFGRVELAAGTEETYKGKINYNRFNEKTQFSIIGNANNLNEQSFSFGEYSDFSGGSSVTYGSALQNGIGGSQGINQSYSTGINLNHEFSEKVKLNLNYFYEQNDNELVSQINARNFTINEEYTTNEVNDNFNSKKRHSVNARFEWKLDSLTEIRIGNNFFLSDNLTDNQSITKYIPTTLNGDLISSDLETDDEKLSSYWDFNLNRRSKKKGRSWLTKYNYYWMNGEKTNQLETSTFGENLNQFQNFDENRIRHRANTVFTEPLNEKWFLSFRYSYQNEKNEPSRLFFDKTNSDLVINDSLSDDFKRQLIENEVRFRVRRTYKKLNFSFGSEFAEINLQTQELSRYFRFIYPFATLQYRIKQSESIRFTYSTNSRAPSLNQLISIPNNTNPNRNYVGNLRLVPEYNHRYNLNYHFFNMQKSLSYFMGATVSKTTDKIINQTIVNNDFTTQTTPVNTGFYEAWNSYASVSGAIKKYNLNYTFGPNLSSSNYDAFLNGLATRVKSESFTASAQLGRDKNEKWDLNVGFDYSINFTEYETNANFNQRFSNFGWSANGEVEITPTLVLIAAYKIQRYNAVSFSEGRILHFVNASIRQTFREGQWSVFIIGNDILNQNIGLRRSNDVNSLREENYNTRTQFFMLGVSRKFGKKKPRSSK